MADKFDVVVIGAGPGGYVCAIRCAQLGFRVACIDKRDGFGGTCLHVGCIPSKALLHASAGFAHMSHMDEMGVEVSQAKLNIKKLMAYKNQVVQDNIEGINFLFKKNKIEGIKGTAKLEKNKKITIKNDVGEKRLIEADHIVLATGSVPIQLPSIKIDEKDILSSEGALCFKKVPKHLMIIGAGIIGLELGSVWRRLGAKVTVVEFLDRITPSADKECAKQFKRLLERQGIVFQLGQKVVDVKKIKNQMTLSLQPATTSATTSSAISAPTSTKKSATKSAKKSTTKSVAKPNSQKLVGDKVLLSIGRRAYTDGLGLDNLGITTDEKGHIEVSPQFETSCRGVYAIGDVIRGAMLAHKAEEEGVCLAEMLAGQKPHMNYHTIPSVIYTQPELAWVGKNEEELKQDKRAYKVGKFPFSANGRAKVHLAPLGFVKILSDAKSDEVLGVHILGQDAGTLIGEAVLGMEFQASAEDIARTCHAHPTLSETLKEAALAVDNRAIHF